MSEKIKLLGDFVYSADAKPKGARLVRRMRFRATTEYEFRSVPSIEAPVALEVQAYDGNELRDISYRAFDGRLWLPAKTDVTPDDYGRTLSEWPLHGWIQGELGEERFWERRGADAIMNAHLPLEEPQWPGDPKGYTREMDFAGEILRSNRSDCQAVYLRAASNQIFVDGVLHRTFPAPVWVVDHNTDHASVQLVAPVHSRETFKSHAPTYGGDYGRYAALSYYDAFTHDRREAALDWAPQCSRCEGGVTVRGAVITDRGGYMPEPPLSYAMLFNMREFLQWVLQLAPHLPDQALGAWVRLNSARRSVTMHDIGLAADCRGMLSDIMEIATPLRDAFLAEHLYDARDAVLRAADRCAERAAFDRRHEPALDESTLASLAG